MISTFVTWPYGTIIASKEPCLILGFQEFKDGSGTRVLVASMKDGEISQVGIKQVAFDVDRLRRLPL